MYDVIVVGARFGGAPTALLLARRATAPAPEQAALLASLRTDAAATERFFGVFSGSVAPHEFFDSPSLSAA